MPAWRLRWRRRSSPTGASRCRPSRSPRRELLEIAEHAESFGHDGRHYVSLLKEPPTEAAIRKIEETATADEVAKVGGRAVHLLLGGSYHEAKLTNAAVEKHLGVATNRNVTVLRALVEKWC